MGLWSGQVFGRWCRITIGTTQINGLSENRSRLKLILDRYRVRSLIPLVIIMHTNLHTNSISRRWLNALSISVYFIVHHKQLVFFFSFITHTIAMTFYHLKWLPNSCATPVAVNYRLSIWGI